MPIASQVSEYGSVAKPRFSGWVEQELGEKKARKYYAALAGRGGGKRRRVKRGFRMDKPYGM